MTSDMKSGLTSGAKPKLSILPRHALIHAARPLEYGADPNGGGYCRGNYHRPAPDELGNDKRAAALRVAGYMDAAFRHGARVTDAINRALGTGGDLAAAVAIVDDVAKGDLPASGLPDLSHMLSSIMVAITCAVDDGLLPADPGQPWRQDDQTKALRRLPHALTATEEVPERKTTFVYNEPVCMTGIRFKTEDEGWQFVRDNWDAFKDRPMREVKTLIYCRMTQSDTPSPLRGKRGAK